MPKIQWTDLPPALREHLFDRVRERRIDADDLCQLKLWRESGPVATAKGMRLQTPTDGSVFRSCAGTGRDMHGRHHGPRRLRWVEGGGILPPCAILFR